MSWFDDNGIEHSGADMGGMTGTPPGAVASVPAGPDYQGALPTGYSRDEVNDFLSRNAGHEGQGYDYGRVMSALNDRGGSGPAPAGAPPPVAGSGVGGAPQSIQPFSFDPSSVGKSDAFKFRFDKALEAIKRVGVAKGSYFNPQTWKAAEDEASGLASQEFGNEFDRQFQTHDWNETNRFNSQRSNRLDDFGMFDTNRRFDRSVYQDDRNYGRGVYENDRNFDYGKTRDTMGDYWKFIDYGYPRSSGLQ